MKPPKFKSIHRIIFSIVFSVIAWKTICLIVIEIDILTYIFIEIIIGIAGFFSTFIKRKMGLIPESREPLITITKTNIHDDTIH